MHRSGNLRKTRVCVMCCREHSSHLGYQGIVVKRGKFTTSEEVAVRDALYSFREVSNSHSSVLRLNLKVRILDKPPIT